MRYATITEKMPNNYSAYVPDLPGCVATGSSIEEISFEIQSAITFHLEGLKLEGLPIPEPTTMCEYVLVKLQHPNLLNLVKRGAEWCKLAYRNDEESWEVDKDSRIEAQIDTKYMLREHIADCASRKNYGSPPQIEVYKKFIENIG